MLADAWDHARPLEPGWTWDRRNPHVAATFEPNARIDYVFVGPPDGDGLGQVLDAELFGMKPAPRPLRLVQYFVNTRDVEDGTDKFVDPAALVAWLEGVGLLGDFVRAREDDLERAVGLREALRTLMLANSGHESYPLATQTLDELSRGLPVTVRFDAEGRARLRERAGSVDGALGHLLGLILCANADGTWRRLKACVNPECQLAFYDASKNRSGIWCDMALCGNRSKGRAHRKRQRAGRT